MISIDGKNLVLNETFILPDGDNATIETTIEGFKLVISFTIVPGKQGEDYSGKWTWENGIVNMTFVGWNNPLGTCLKKPEKFGDIGGKPLGLQLSVHSIGDAKLVTFMLFLGGKYE